MFKLIIFDFDGTIFDTYEAISHCARLTFETLTPSATPPSAELRRLISKGAALAEAFRLLHPDQQATFDAETWTNTYRALYAQHGQALSKPYAGLRLVLDALKAANIRIAIVSNKVTDSIKTALKQLDLLDEFPEPLIIGDNIEGSQRKPHPVSYMDILLPRYRALYGEEALRPEEVLMVGDTVTDILYARNVGMKVCWCRYGQGDAEECEALKPEFTIDDLEGVLEVAMGSR
ncbi:Non-essential glycogen phosphorylase [Aspergillus nanangensis]|uniref:Non-essential glycogen phosphorylase n=1 Tax=Aspergillus nanangensis TaxID=2582783 RepID=A0AAD4GU71_ASPNN|nr:Non-essential glycogen phosphorylase [Aspergillus nanangensis]